MYPVLLLYKGRLYIGGLIGVNNATATVNRCYATGVANVVDGVSEGGLIGELKDRSCTGTYYFFNIATKDNSYGIATTLADMQLQTTYAGWNFSTIWGINAGINSGYPYLLDNAP